MKHTYIIYVLFSSITELIILCRNYQHIINTLSTHYQHIQHFNFQLTHTTLKNVELLKHSKISKTAPTCFGLQGNQHQGATVST